MKIYESKSSLFVKIITVSTLVVMSIIAITLITTYDNYSLIGGIVLSLVIIGTVIYFYANSLEKIIVEKEILILKKNIGQVKIPFIEIKDVKKLEYSNLTMTFGSKGVFGFIGNTMDDSISYVKDRKNMLKIVTNERKYILSSERAVELISEIKNLMKHPNNPLLLNFILGIRC